MKYDTIISLIFYICGCFYLIYGSAIVVTSARNDISKLFLFLTSSLAIWSFAYSISNSVSTAEASAFWRSFSVLGWGSFNSFLLHFITLLTKTETRLTLRSKLVVFYLPSVINVILFGPFGVFLEKQYVMVQTDFGWINIAPMYPAKIWLILYFIVFSVASLIFLVKWWKKIRFYTSLEKREAKFFIASILVFFFIEIVVDFLPDISRKISFPKMPVVLLLIPTILLFSLLKKSELIKRSRDINFFPESSKSITTEVRLRLFNTAAAIFVIGSALYFLIGYFGMKKALGYELLFSAALLLMGITLRVLPRITQNQTIQNTAFALISTFGFMLFMIKDSDTGALTVWASYILFFILAVVMGNPIHIYGFATISIIAQAVLWIVRPQVSVIIDINEYIGRIFIIILSFIAVRYLTDEYASKIDGYQGLLSEQEALERISSSFISIDSENAKEKVDEMMEMAAEILKFKNAFLVRFSEEYENATILNMYAKDIESVPSIYHPGNKVKISDFPLFKFLIDRNTFVICEDIANISFDEDGRQKDFFMDRGVKSFFAMPIIADNKIDGVFIVEYNDMLDTGLAQSRLNLLQIIANMLGDANKKLFYEEKLYNFAYFDEATKLANRNMLKKKLGEIIKNGKGREKIAIIDFELENLRMINDTFGQSVGDKIVMRSVEILKNQFDECCYISRPGIREFIVVMPDVKNRQQIEYALKRLMNSFSRPLLTDIGGIEALFVTVCMGISMYPDDGRDVDTLLKKADMARFEAKNTYDKIVFFTEQMESYIAENTLFTNRLFNSLENEEFFLEFQPQISCDTGKTIGIEALLRWTSDGDRRVSPDRLIPILEQTGLICDVGLWVLKQAIQEHSRLIAKGLPPLRIAVNLSIVQLQRENFVYDFVKIIEESGISPKYIELEITESSFFKNPEDIIEKIRKLKKLGVTIAIDDFGKGYSSLNRLKSVPFDRIKIDKEIIDYMDFEGKEAPITKSIILLAKAYSANITVEGVETKEQADFLKSMSCNEIQGFYFSKPLSSKLLEDFLKNESCRYCPAN